MSTSGTTVKGLKGDLHVRKIQALYEMYKNGKLTNYENAQEILEKFEQEPKTMLKAEIFKKVIKTKQEMKILLELYKNIGPVITVDNLKNKPFPKNVESKILNIHWQGEKIKYMDALKAKMKQIKAKNSSSYVHLNVNKMYNGLPPIEHKYFVLDFRPKITNFGANLSEYYWPRVHKNLTGKTKGIHMYNTGDWENAKNIIKKLQKIKYQISILNQKSP